MWVAAVIGVLAVVSLVALILLSRRLGQSESELDQRVEDVEAFERFRAELLKPVPETEDEARELLRRR